MGDEEELVSEFGRSELQNGENRFPIGRVVFGFMLNTMGLVGHKVGSYRTSENALFGKLMEELLPGDLIVGDRRFAGAKLFVEYRQKGLEFIIRAHPRLKVGSLKVVNILGNNDLIVEVLIPKVYRRKDPTLPEVINVRAIKTEAKIQGKKESFWLMTFCWIVRNILQRRLNYCTKRDGKWRD